MRSSASIRTLLLALLVGVPLLDCDLRAAPGDEAKSPREDRYGDPLPAGAIARFGTTRLVHPGGVGSVAISPDGKLVATGERKVSPFGVPESPQRPVATIRLWNARKGTLLHEITALRCPVSALTFDASGRILYAACGTRACALDTATGRTLWERTATECETDDDQTEAAKIVVAGERLIILNRINLSLMLQLAGGVTQVGTIQLRFQIWDRRSGKQLPTPSGLASSTDANTYVPRYFHSCDLSRDGRYAAILVSRASLSANSSAPNVQWKYSNLCLQIVETHTGKVVRSLVDVKEEAHSLTLSSNCELVALNYAEKVVLYRIADGKKSIIPVNPEEAIGDLVFMPGDRQLLARTGNSYSVHTIDSGKGFVPASPQVRAYDVWSGRIAACMNEHCVDLYDLESGSRLLDLEGHRQTPTVQFSLNSKDVLYSRDSKELHVWDIKSRSNRETVAVPPNIVANGFDLSDVFSSGVCTEKQRYLINKGEAVELCDLKTHRTIHRFALSGTSDPQLALCRSGTRISWSDENVCQIFDAETGKMILKMPKTAALNVLLSGQGNILATGEEQQRIHLCDAATGKRFSTLVPRSVHNSQSFVRFAFSDDEQIAMAELGSQALEEESVLMNSYLIIWNVRSGEVLQEIEIDGEAITVGPFFKRTSCFTISPDHRLVALGRPQTNTIEIFEVASGSKRGELQGHIAPVVDLCFSPDGRQLATSSLDTTILLWDMLRPLDPVGLPPTLSAGQLAECWESLQNRDAAKADTAIWRLVRGSQDALPFLKEHLRPVAAVDSGRVRHLLADLDEDDFKQRTRAEAELASLGQRALGELESALGEQNSLHKQRRLEFLIHKALEDARPFASPESIRQERALEVLEKIGSNEARALLRALAGGTPRSRLTTSAQEVLARFKVR
jgi:WD40 repeat protein